MFLLTLGKRRKVPGVYTESQERPRGVRAVIEACDTRPLYVHNEFIRVKTLEHPAEHPLNERQMNAVQEFKAMLQKSVDEDLAMTRVVQ